MRSWRDWIWLTLLFLDAMRNWGGLLAIALDSGLASFFPSIWIRFFMALFTAFNWGIYLACSSSPYIIIHLARWLQVGGRVASTSIGLGFRIDDKSEKHLDRPWFWVTALESCLQVFCRRWDLSLDVEEHYSLLLFGALKWVLATTATISIGIRKREVIIGAKKVLSR